MLHNYFSDVISLAVSNVITKIQPVMGLFPASMFEVALQGNFAFTTITVAELNTV